MFFGWLTVRTLVEYGRPVEGMQVILDRRLMRMIQWCNGLPVLLAGDQYYLDDPS